jgi:hypothetical protein
MLTQEDKRLEHLATLAPVDAVRVWLAGDFRMGDEPAFSAAIRQDSRVLLSDEAIEDAILDAIDNGLNAPACLQRLAGR